MTKAELLAELCDNTFIMLKPSAIEGIGIFAIRDIPKGCRAMFSPPSPSDKWLAFSRTEVAALPGHAKHVVENYCLYDDKHYFVPDHGFKKMDLSLFLNHSDSPNVISINDGAYFEAIREIKSGEELVIDYGELVDDSL